MENWEIELNQILKQERRVKRLLKKKNYNKSLVNDIEKRFERYLPDIKYIDKMSYKGNKFLRLMFKSNKFMGVPHFSKNSVQNIGDKFSEFLNTKNIHGDLMIATKYNTVNWRNGGFTPIGEPVNLYAYADSDIRYDGDENKENFDSFVIYLVLKPNNVGGNTEKNDCLYDCLKFILNDILPFNKAWELKKYLKLQRTEKISITFIPKIEKLLKTFQINIKGDYIYSSTIKSNKQVNLLLINEHYTIDKEYHKYKFPKIPIHNKEKIPVIYNKSSFEIYDGIKSKKTTKEEINKILWDKENKYVLVDKNKYNFHENIDDQYKTMIDNFNILKKASNGYINMFKTGNIKKTCLNLFDRFTKYIKNPEPIQQDEYYFIENSKKGALIWSQLHEGKGYKYDVKSMYPFILDSIGKFPIARGEFMNINDIDNLEYFQFGIYRCIVKKSDDDKNNRLFRFNINNYYTHTSLEHAKSINLEIVLIKDDKPNFLFYSRDKLISYHEVFNKYVSLLFGLKEKKTPLAKSILNMLWGCLCEKDKKKYYTFDKCNISEEQELIDIRPCFKDENEDCFITVNMYNPYKTTFSRLAPFLLSKGRYMISNLMKPHINNIHYFHTDGFISDADLNINGSKMGDLVYEGYYENIKIVNVSSIFGEMVKVV